MPRAIATGQIAFGLVSIPVKLFSAAESSEKIAFNMLHRDCGSRVQQHLFCPKCYMSKSEAIFCQKTTFSDHSLRTRRAAAETGEGRPTIGAHVNLGAVGHPLRTWAVHRVAGIEAGACFIVHVYPRVGP